MLNQKPLSGELIDYGNSLSDGLVAYWPFSENNNSDKVYDLSGNEKTGTITGCDWVLGKFGPTLDFKGNYTDYITVSLTVSIPFTFVAWIYPESYDGLYCYFWGDNGTNDAVRINNATDSLVLRLDGTSYTASTTAMSVGSWYHTAVVVDSSGVLTYYVNGQPAGGDTAVSGTFNLTYIGRRGTVQADHVSWNGKIDLPMIYSRDLSTSEIASLYYPFSITGTRRRIIYDEIAAAPSAAAVPIFSKNGIHSLIFGGQILAA